MKEESICKNNSVLFEQLNSFMPAAGLVCSTTASGERVFTEIGLELTLKTAKGFLRSLNSLIAESTETRRLTLPTAYDTALAEATEIGKLFTKHGSDKATQHRYDLIYQPIFDELRQRKTLNIMEIGLGTNNTNIVSHMGKKGTPGASLYAYREFFENANIYGADVDKTILFESERIKTAYVDQLEPTTFVSMYNQFGRPPLDLFIEDGLHSVTASINSLTFAIRNINENGYIILEDLYNPGNIWSTLTIILKALFDFQIVEFKNSGGNVLIIKK